MSNDSVNGKVYFVGSKYEVRILNEGTQNEKVMIFKKSHGDNKWDTPWKQPLSIGG